MIKFRIVDDEFNSYKEDFVVKEFKQFDAIESFRPQETATPPQESINIQEDTAIGQRQNLYANRHQEFNNNDFNKNTSNSSQSDGSMNNSSSSNTSDVSSTSGTSSSSSTSTSSSATSSGSSSGANVSGGEGLTAASSSTAAATGTTAAASGAAATTTAASVAGTFTVVAAAIVSIVVIAANIIKTAPTVFMNYFLVGTNYISFLLNIDNLDSETEYELSVSNPTFDKTYNLRNLLNSDGLYEGYVTGLTPNRYYTLTVSSISSESDVPIPHFSFEFITKSEEINPVYKATYDLSYETSVGTSDTCYQYVYTMNTKFDNSAQSSDSYELQLVAGDGIILDRYEGTSSTVSLACNYDQTSVDVYLVPITTINGKKYTFDKQKLTTISNPSLVGESTVTLRPNNTFRLDNYEAPLLTDVGTDFVCKCFIGSAAAPVTQTFKDDMVAITGNSSGVDSITLQIQDTAGKIAGQQTISLQETTTQEIIFYATGNYTLTDGYTITTNITDAPTFGDNEGYRLIVTNDDKSVFFGMGDRSTATTNNYTVPDLSYDFYRACLAPYRIVGNVEYVFENAAAENTDGCEHVFSAFEAASLVFDKDYSEENFVIGVSDDYSSQNVDIIATITNIYTNGSKDSFNVPISAGLTEANNSMTLTESLWNTLDRTEIVITNDSNTITYAKYTYTKAETELEITSYDVVAKKLILNPTINDCPDTGEIANISFTDKSNVIGDAITYDGSINNGQVRVAVDEISSATMNGTWSYTFVDNGYNISVSGFVGTSTALNLEATVNYYLDGETSYGAGDAIKVYVDGYPTINGKEINLDSWELSFYSDSAYSQIIQLSNETNIMGQMYAPDRIDMLYLMDNIENEFYYKMTYGSNSTVLNSAALTVPTEGYDFISFFEDSSSPSVYGTYVANALTFNLNETTIESTNMYNTYNFVTTGKHYQQRIAYGDGYGNYNLYRSEIDSTHPYLALEDIPYAESYLNGIYAFRTEIIGDKEYQIYLGEVTSNSPISAMLVDGALNAVRGVQSQPTYTDDSSTKYIDIYTTADYLISGASLELYIGSSTTPIEINPQTVMGQEYAAHDYDQSVDGYSVIINNHQAQVTESATVAIQVIFADYNVDATGTRLVVKNKARTGASELAQYNISTKGYVFALDDAQYTLKDINGDTVQFTEYTRGNLGGTISLYAIDSEVTMITEFIIA